MTTLDGPATVTSIRTFVTAESISPVPMLSLFNCPTRLVYIPPTQVAPHRSFHVVPSGDVWSRTATVDAEVSELRPPRLCDQ